MKKTCDLPTIKAMPRPSFWDGFHEGVNDVRIGFMTVVTVLVTIYLCCL